MTGYKKCIYFSNDGYYRVFECIVQLEIPDDAKVVRPLIVDKFTSRESNKLRCSRALVKAIFTIDGFKMPDDTVAYSVYRVDDIISYALEDTKTFLNAVKDIVFKYAVGMTVRPEEKFSESIFTPCASGIHFFATLEEATKYEGLACFIYRIRKVLLEGRDLSKDEMEKIIG